ncbi:MAG: hypothetical protein HC782_00225 [Gammaproteobacteria bacterium]|nr:hypothetical protein [Gammaproteobacteria bacterium]
MNRRQFIASLSAISVAPQVLAHHGWSSFDEARPLYFEGVVKQVKWQNPHAEVVITVAQNAVMPNDLAKRTWPAQTQTVDSKKNCRRHDAAYGSRRMGTGIVSANPH